MLLYLLCDTYFAILLFSVQASTSTADDSSSSTSGDSDVVAEPKGKEKCECMKDKADSVFVLVTRHNYFYE